MNIIAKEVLSRVRKNIIKESNERVEKIIEKLNKELKDSFDFGEDNNS